MEYTHKPEILAPAGDMPAALSALAAGADAVYLGLKHFSARMQADNFSSTDLAALVDLAHSENRKIYLAMNTFFKPGEVDAVARLIRRLMLGPHPDAIIAQDPAIIDLARQAGFDGEIHLSTLANITHQEALISAQKLGAQRIILPRELSIDEIRLMNDAKPHDLGMELFVHGALCYCVSGRCWWSSYMGGKSGLRGRCVQPCRRVYRQGGKEGRFFSCRDLSIDVLAKVLLELPGVNSWKIEGRKKGPHYVFYTVTAYKMLRDHSADPAMRREAENLLGMALGRPNTRARFLPQRATSPTAFGNVDPAAQESALSGQTSSGLLCGKITSDREGHTILKTRMELLAQDYLRIGYEDEKWHSTLPVSRRTPKHGSLTLKLPRHKIPKNGTPVFLIDRREPELMALIKKWQHRLDAIKPIMKEDPKLMSFAPVAPKVQKGKGARPLDIALRGYLPKGRDAKDGIRPGSVQGLWLSPRALSDVSRTLFSRISWWLPPVIWPEDEPQLQKLIHHAVRGGARHFVCGAPWQIELFQERKGLAFTAGPFCNLTNHFAVAAMQEMGFSQAIVSPELGEQDYLTLPALSPLPLGIVLSGFWPMGITRHSITPLKQAEQFTSPMREGFWAKRYGQDMWIYPSWPLDISAHRPALEKAGYSTFVSIVEQPPKTLPKAERSSQFNWVLDVL